MNNGDSFHNGSENLELQRKNRLGLSEDTSSSSPSATETPSQESSVQTSSTPRSDPELASAANPATASPVSAQKTGGASQVSSPRLSATSPAYDPAQQQKPPHERPYVNIYASGGVSYPGGSRPKPAAPEPTLPPSERGYTNIYAKRVADRAEEPTPGHYSNTPDLTGGIPYYGDMAETSTGKATAAPDYASSGFSDESGESQHKKSFNIAALILGISAFAGNMLCLTCLTPVAAILAIVFGCMGRVGGKFEQKGLTGFILGIVYCGLAVLMLLYVFIFALLNPSGMGA